MADAGHLDGAEHGSDFVGSVGGTEFWKRDEPDVRVAVFGHGRGDGSKFGVGVDQCEFLLFGGEQLPGVLQPGAEPVEPDHRWRERVDDGDAGVGYDAE